MKRTGFIGGFVTIALIFGATACSKSEDEAEVSGYEQKIVSTRTIELTEKQKDDIGKNNDFAFNLYRAVSQSKEMKGKSNVISPLSLTYALGMLNTGATGQTSKELQALLGFGDSDEASINSLCSKLIREMPKVDELVELGIVNLMAIDKSFELEGQFREDLNLYYDAEIASLPFGAKESADFINNWANEHSHGLIPHLVDNLYGAMAILNAIYFNAPWSNELSSDDTRQEQFEKRDGQQISLPMMNGKTQTSSYAKANNYQTLRLPYGTSNNWAMYILLPDKGTTTDEVIAELTNASWTKTLQKMKQQAANVKLPRFKTETTLDELVDILTEMGAPSMFQPRQELLRISSSNKDLCVGKALQKAAIDVNEEGTTAAAVTILSMEIMNLGTKIDYLDFYATRPFVYLIQEASSGAIFFIGTYQGD